MTFCNGHDWTRSLTYTSDNDKNNTSQPKIDMLVILAEPMCVLSIKVRLWRKFKVYIVSRLGEFFLYKRICLFYRWKRQRWHFVLRKYIWGDKTEQIDIVGFEKRPTVLIPGFTSFFSFLFVFYLCSLHLTSFLLSLFSFFISFLYHSLLYNKTALIWQGILSTSIFFHAVNSIVRTIYLA